jgi:hypothetical protein
MDKLYAKPKFKFVNESGWPDSKSEMSGREFHGMTNTFDEWDDGESIVRFKMSVPR